MHLGLATATWKAAHEHCLTLAKRMAALDHEIGRALLAAQQAAVDRRLGYGSFFEYCERLFGWSPKVTTERLRVAAALEALPATQAALTAGQIAFSTVRELTRVATPATEAAWLTSATGRTVREVEALVSGRRPGDLPSDPADPQAERHLLRFEVDASTYALLRQAMAALRDEQGESISEEQGLALMARAVLGGPRDEGRASHQILITECPSCGLTQQDGDGRSVVVSDQVADRAACDAQVVSGDRRAAYQDVPPATRRAVLRRDGGRCRAPGCRAARFLDVHHVVPRASGGSHDADNLLTLCGRHHDAVHEGRLVVATDPVGGTRFAHADGSDYGTTASPAATDLWADCFVALKSLGWKEREVRRVLETVRPHVGPDEALEALIRRCLAALAGRN